MNKLAATTLAAAAGAHQLFMIMDPNGTAVAIDSVPLQAYAP